MLVGLVALCLLLSGCNFDIYGGKRPFDYGAAQWVCENPSAWFVVNPDDEDYYCPKGEVCVDDKTLQFELIFVTGTDLVFFKIINTSAAYYGGYRDAGFDGECTFSSSEFVITIDKETDTVFGGQYDTLTFTRISSE